MEEREMITVTEAAEMLGISPVTLYRWLQEGRIPAIQYGTKTIRLRRSQVLAYIEAHSKPGISVLGKEER